MLITFGFYVYKNKSLLEYLLLTLAGSINFYSTSNNVYFLTKISQFLIAFFTLLDFGLQKKFMFFIESIITNSYMILVTNFFGGLDHKTILKFKKTKKFRKRIPPPILLFYH